MSEQLPPMVCLDGTKVRTIREQQKLTQLYVAKVVGVTTDTISRWENNRYPSIKKENVLRLAEALEVDVELLLKEDGEGGDVSSGVELQRPRRAGFWILAGGILVAVVIGIFMLVTRRDIPPAPMEALRLLPTYAAPGNIIPVQVHLETEGESKGFILREHFPSGWKLIEANPPASSLDNEKGIARWIIRAGDNRRHFVYLIRVAGSAEIGTQADFSGEIVANADERQSPVPVGGSVSIKVEPFQWADLNGDRTIDDSEILRAYDMVEDMTGVHLDWEIVDNIWDAGSYRWDEKTKKFIPVKLTIAPLSAN